jgi:hypothetical protein
MASVTKAKLWIVEAETVDGKWKLVENSKIRKKKIEAGWDR